MVENAKRVEFENEWLKNRWCRLDHGIFVKSQRLMMRMTWTTMVMRMTHPMIVLMMTAQQQQLVIANGW